MKHDAEFEIAKARLLGHEYLARGLTEQEAGDWPERDRYLWRRWYDRNKCSLEVGSFEPLTTGSFQYDPSTGTTSYYQIVSGGWYTSHCFPAFDRDREARKLAGAAQWKHNPLVRLAQARTRKATRGKEQGSKAKGR